MTDPEGNLTAPAQGRCTAEYTYRRPSGMVDGCQCVEEEGHEPPHWCEHGNDWGYPDPLEAANSKIADLEARLSQALEERDAWKQRFEDDAHDFHEMSEQLNAALEAQRLLREALPAIGRYGHIRKYADLYCEIEDFLTPGAPARVQEED